MENNWLKVLLDDAMLLIVFTIMVILLAGFGLGYANVTRNTVNEQDLIHMCETKGYYNIDQTRIKCSVEK